ncbi:DUF4170 domain-containing protein [Alphaproteobacteria bacterium]|nr:DUF4170 domain-containing protein [Alphaproteobacteria bacterium]
MKDKQNLYLVFGGKLKKIGLDAFSNINSLEYVGIYDSLKEAKKSWKSSSIKNIDYANKKFKLVPLFNLFDPTENIIDYLSKLKLKNIKIDKVIFSPQDKLIDASKKFKKLNAGAGVVIDSKKLLGIITERDIIRIIATKRNNILETKLKSFMTKKVVFIDVNYSLIEAIELLKSSAFRHLPIYDIKKQVFYGIISYKDFLLGEAH